MNKRGLSPILATVLLIAFVVAIGAMIISFIPSSPSSVTCETINVDVINQNAFCRLQDKIVPRVSVEKNKYEACLEHEIILSALPYC